MSEEITVTIGPDGKVSLHVEGAEGDSCLDLTAPLENALGGEVVSRVMTGGEGGSFRPSGGKGGGAVRKKIGI